MDAPRACRFCGGRIGGQGTFWYHLSDPGPDVREAAPHLPEPEPDPPRQVWPPPLERKETGHP